MVLDEGIESGGVVYLLEFGGENFESRTDVPHYHSGLTVYSGADRALETHEALMDINGVHNWTGIDGKRIDRRCRHPLVGQQKRSAYDERRRQVVHDCYKCVQKRTSVDVALEHGALVRARVFDVIVHLIDQNLCTIVNKINCPIKF